MDIDFVTIALYMVNVLVLIFAFNRWALKPVRKFMADREARYAERLSEIEKQELAAKEMQAKAQSELEGIHAQAQTIIDEGRQKGKEVYDHNINEAHEKAETIIARAEKDAERIRSQATDEAQGDIVDLAVDIAQRVLGEEIKKQDHDKMIQEILEVK